MPPPPHHVGPQHWAACHKAEALAPLEDTR
jgi:hypothetical protein